MYLVSTSVSTGMFRGPFRLNQSILQTLYRSTKETSTVEYLRNMEWTSRFMVEPSTMDRGQIGTEQYSRTSFFPAPMLMQSLLHLSSPVSHVCLPCSNCSSASRTTLCFVFQFESPRR